MLKKFLTSYFVLPVLDPQIASHGGQTFMRRLLSIFLAAALSVSYTPAFAAGSAKITGGGPNGEVMYNWGAYKDNYDSITEYPYNANFLRTPSKSYGTYTYYITNKLGGSGKDSLDFVLGSGRTILTQRADHTHQCGLTQSDLVINSYDYNYENLHGETDTLSQPTANGGFENSNLTQLRYPSVTLNYSNRSNFKYISGLSSLSKAYAYFKLAGREYCNLSAPYDVLVELSDNFKYLTITSSSSLGISKYSEDYIYDKIIESGFSQDSTITATQHYSKYENNQISAYGRECGRRYDPQEDGNATFWKMCKTVGYRVSLDGVPKDIVLDTASSDYSVNVSPLKRNGLKFSRTCTQTLVDTNLFEFTNEIPAKLQSFTASPESHVSFGVTLGEGTTTLLSSRLASGITVPKGSVVKLFNTTISCGEHVGGYNGNTYTTNNVFDNRGGIAVVYSGTFEGSIGSDSFVLGEGSTIKEQSGNKLVVESMYGSWTEIEGGDNNVTIEMGDMVAPMITVKRDPVSISEPVDKVTFTISATDAQGNDADKPISIDGGDWQTSPYQFEVTENGNHTIWATDSEGNIREANLSVNNIDEEPPEIISLTPNKTDYTNEEVRVTANAQDDQKLAEQPYYWSFTPSNKTGTSIAESASASKTFTVTENGKLTLRVKDAMGKMSEEESITINNIDKTAPTITGYKLSPDSNANTKDGVTITVNVVDTADATGYTSGMPDNNVCWDGIWGTNKLTVHENGTVQVKVRDKLGNVSPVQDISVNCIDDGLPYIGSITRDKNASYITAPLKVTAEGFDSDGTPLTGRSYSWDEGKSWGSSKTKTITENGEYIITVRDSAGNTASETIIVDNIDSFKPTVELRLVREKRLNPTTGKEKDYWVLKVEANDVGSGVNYMETDWDGKTTYGAFCQSDVTSAGVYGVKVYDMAGNSTYQYLTISNEMMGITNNNSSTSGNTTNVDVDINGVGDTGVTIGGIKAEFANPSNLVYGKNGIYNKVTKHYSTYEAAGYPDAGIALTVTVEPREDSFVSGFMSLEGVNYDMKFDSFNSDSKVEVAGTTLYGFIPFSSLTTDLKNRRLKIQINEHEDSDRKTLVREGSATLYVSVQVSDPVIRYTYNKVSSQLTLVPTSTVAGVKSASYSINGGTEVSYGEPFTVEKGASVKLSVTDNVNKTVSITLDSNNLALEGGSGSLPTEGLNPDNGSVSSYRMSSRTMDTYLINGNQSNTDQVPSSAIFELFK